MPSNLIVQLKLKCLMKKPIHDDIILHTTFFLKDIKGKLVCVFKVCQYISS